MVHHSRHLVLPAVLFCGRIHIEQPPHARRDLQMKDHMRMKLHWANGPQTHLHKWIEPSKLTGQVLDL